MPHMLCTRQILQQKLGSKPFGIWIAWVALLYTLILESWRLWVLWKLPVHVPWSPTNVDSFLGLPILFLAILSLLLRRFAACIFVSMSLLLMLRTALTHAMPFGILLAIFGFLGLIANRRWFDERLPRAS